MSDDTQVQPTGDDHKNNSEIMLDDTEVEETQDDPKDSSKTMLDDPQVEETGDDHKNISTILLDDPHVDETGDNHKNSSTILLDDPHVEDSSTILLDDSHVEETGDDHKNSSTILLDDTHVETTQDDPICSGYLDPNDGLSLNEIVDQIRGNILKINNGANSVERNMKIIGTVKDSTHLRFKIHETCRNTNKIVQTTTLLLRSAAGKKAKEQETIKVNLLRVIFQEAVQRVHALQMRVVEKARAAVKLTDHSTHKPLISFDSDTDQKAISKEEQQQKQALKDQAQFIDANHPTMHDRKKCIDQFEKDILDVDEIFRVLGSSAQAHRVVNDTLTHDVQQASNKHASNIVEIDDDELLKEENDEGMSGKQICCLFILFLTAAIIIIFIMMYYKILKL